MSLEDFFVQHSASHHSSGDLDTYRQFIAQTVQAYLEQHEVSFVTSIGINVSTPKRGFVNQGDVQTNIYLSQAPLIAGKAGDFIDEAVRTLLSQDERFTWVDALATKPSQSVRGGLATMRNVDIIYLDETKARAAFAEKLAKPTLVAMYEVPDFLLPTH